MNNNLLDKKFKAIIIKGYSMNSEWNEYSEKFNRVWKYKSFPGGSDGKESACNAGDLSSIPGLGSSPGEGNGYLLQ